MCASTLGAGRACLLVLLALLAGCWNSHRDQEADDRPSADGHHVPVVGGTEMSHDRSLPGSKGSSSPEKAVAAIPPHGADEELGFKHTLKPGASQPAKPSKSDGSPAAPGDTILVSSTHAVKSTTTGPAVVAQAGAEDDRYADLARSPAVGGSEPPKMLPGAIESARVEPAKTDRIGPHVGHHVPMVVAGGAAGNPLRGGGAETVAGRPAALPQPLAEPEPDAGTMYPSAAVKTSSPAVAATQVAQNSQLVIQVKPDDSAAGKAIAPAAPDAGAAGKKPEPQGHGSEPVRTGPRTGKNSGVPFDPEKVNGKIFVNWPKPNLALVITGNQEGYLEPCGCAGLDRMKGGMSRRYTFFRQLRDKGWPVVGIDVGGIAKGFGKQAELKFQIAVNAMSGMRYSTATLGLTDLHLPAAEVMANTMPADAKKKTMFVSGNVGLFEFNETLLPRTQLIAAGYKTIGVTAVLGKTYIKQLANNTDLKTIDPERLLSEAVPLLKARANYLVLLAHTTHAEAVNLANKFPDIDLVICSEGGAEPPAQAEEIRKGGTKLVVVGEKGMYAVVLGLFDDPQQPFRYQRVALDSRFPPSPEMRTLMSAYQGQLKEMGLSGLGIRPLQHPLKPYNGDFVGTDACKNCHEESYRVWKKSAHSHAFATLKERQAAAGLRSGVHQLPYRGLAPDEVLSLSKRLPE